MRDLIKNGLHFIKHNPTILSSLALIVIVIGSLFFNTYYTVKNFQDLIDKNARDHSLLATKIIHVLGADFFVDLQGKKEALANYLKQIHQDNDEIEGITVFEKNSENKFVISISTDNKIQEESEFSKKNIQTANDLAWSVNDEIAYIGNDGQGNRFWTVVKAIRLNQEPVAIISIKSSLEKSDSLMEESIKKTYYLAFFSIVLVLLLLLNHVRLFAYQIKAKKLEEVDHMKDDFISMASHELKTPLTVIRGYLDLFRGDLKRGDTSREEKYINNIDLSVKRLVELVDDILEVSRIEQNRFPIEIKAMDIAPLIQELVDQFQISAKDKNLSLSVDLQTLSPVMVDENRFKQILINLIGNAIKYTKRGGVHINAKEDDVMCYITVADTGVGMSATHMKNLFAKFYRIKTDETEGIPGTGLGLWICKEIIQKMGGDIIAESIEGVGSHFTISIPKVK